MTEQTVTPAKRRKQARIPQVDLFGSTLMCTKCGVSRDVSHFGSNVRNGKRYTASHCNVCQYEYRRQWWKRQPDSVKQAHYDTVNHRERVDVRARATTLLKAVKTRCRDKGKVCEIDRNFILDRLKQGVCSATGFKFFIGYSRTGFYSPFSPSVDCIEPTEGYTLENTQVVCTMYNIGKSHHSELDFKAMCMAVALRNMGDPEVHKRMQELTDASSAG